MKQAFSLLLILLLVLAVFPGCTARESGVSPGTLRLIAEDPSASSPELPPPSELTHEAACELFAQAESAFAWYYLGIMDLDTAQSIRDDTGMYYRCIDGRLPADCTMDDLKAYFHTWFSTGFIDTLFCAYPQFTEKDGVLYAAGNGCGSDPFAGDVRVSEDLEKLSDTELRMTVYVEVLGDTGQPTGEEKEHRFPLVFQAGRWGCREFDLVR